MGARGINRGIGCVAIFPAAIIGFAGLTDGIGPTGWRGLSELFGWSIVCLVSAGGLGLLLTRVSQVDKLPYGLTLAAVGGIGALAYELLEWLGLGAPVSAKVLFTSSVQVLGALGAGICVLLIAKTIWKHPRH